MDNSNSSPVNPYAPPQTDVAAQTAEVEDAEAIRHELLNHEASVRAIGSLNNPPPQPISRIRKPLNGVSPARSRSNSAAICEVI